MSLELRATRFWTWFGSNEERFRDLRVPQKEQLLDELLAHLHEYCPQLFFQVGGAPDGPRELIITAEGEAESFDEVSLLVSRAPTVDGWKIVAFMPPAGFDFVTAYESITVEPAKMWFLPLTSEADRDRFGLHVALANYSHKDALLFEQAIRVVLQTGLGELAAAREIHFFEVGVLPASPEAQGYIEMRKLPRYLEGRRSGIASGRA